MEERVPMLATLIVSGPFLAAVPLEPFVHGLVLAFGLVVPLGPQNLFVFSRGSNSLRFRQALPAILTAAMCDTALILLAVVGISAAVLQISFLRVALLAAGVAFLSYIGWVTWNSRSASDPEADAGACPSALAQIALCCSVSLLNPHAVLDTVAVIGTNSLVYTGTDKVSFTLATIGVSWFWFFGPRHNRPIRGPSQSYSRLAQPGFGDAHVDHRLISPHSILTSCCNKLRNCGQPPKRRRLPIRHSLIQGEL
jgi:L-lysine exporter family protein LysE/ArgO